MPLTPTLALLPVLVGSGLFGGGAASAAAPAQLSVTPVVPGLQVAATPLDTTEPTPTTPAATTPSGGKAGVEGDAAPRRCVTDSAIAAARQYARTRPGGISFAVFERGQLRNYRGAVPYRSASLVKAMLLVAELRQHAASHRSLDGGAKARLASMIRTSDNAAATATFNTIGQGAVLGVAHLAGMTHYSVNGYWGSSELTATDQARLWGHLDQYLPDQYRVFGRRLLRTVVHAQTWGGAPVARSHGYRTMFKSGWLPRTDGWVVHQGLRLERGRCRVGVAILTGRQSSMATGVETIRGITERLL